ncbi:MAG: hypothetical protein AAFZ89_15025, partial [Bacteroidota bacterium]
MPPPEVGFIPSSEQVDTLWASDVRGIKQNPTHNMGYLNTLHILGILRYSVFGILHFVYLNGVDGPREKTFV